MIVEIRVVPDSPSILVLMIGTVLLVTPFTVVLSVLALEVLLMEFIIGTVLLVIPLTVVLMVLALEVLLTPDTAEDVVATPLTVEVRVLVERDSEFVVAVANTEAGVTLTQLVPLLLYCSRLPLASDDMETGVPCIFPTVLAPRSPVTSPAIATVYGVLPTPFMVLIN